MAQIARLYQPLSGSVDDYDLDDEDDEGTATQLLPTHIGGRNDPVVKKHARLSNVWDAREEVFAIDSDSEEDAPRGQSFATGSGPQPPQIIVSSS